LNTQPLPHIEATLKKDLDLLKTKLAEMANRAEKAHWEALSALKNKDRQLAYAVIMRDQYIDELEIELDKQCQEFIIRHQPAGAHLRFVLSVVKIIKELERVGDYAESIARQVLVLSAIPTLPPLDKIEMLARIALPMLKSAIKCLLESDAKGASDTLKQELAADKLRREIDSELACMREKNQFVFEAFTPLLTIVRRLERVSDQARNICEETLYMATGEYVRHKGSDIFRFLLVDADGSCLAFMGETIGKSLNIPKFVFESACLVPNMTDKRTIDFLRSKGLPSEEQLIKTFDQVENKERLSVIIALSPECKNILPQHDSKIMGLEWLMENPLKQSDINAALEKAFNFLKSHLIDLTGAIRGEIGANKTKE